MSIKYFDHAATTKIDKEVLEEMLPYLKEEYGNASSLYSVGRASRKAIEEARQKVADLIHCKPNEIYFTGCGTESNNTIIKGIAHQNRNKGKHIITSQIEHPAILHTCQRLEKEGFQVTYVGVDKNGTILIEELKNAIRNDTILISIMTANNEIGTIQPIEMIAKIAKMHNIIFHTDAVQGCGNIPIDVEKMGIDSLSLSGHKLYAPKGVGALYVKSGIAFEKFMDGGHQEKNKRGGTENVAGIVALGKACEIANENLFVYMNQLKELRDDYETKINQQVPNIKINGAIENRLPGNSNISFSAIQGETLLLKLDAKQICASSGSACTSGSSAPSHVLTAIGLSKEQANASLRVSFGKENTTEDVDYLVKELSQIVRQLRNNNE